MTVRQHNPTSQPFSWSWITTIAFVVAVALVIGRATMSEFLRDPFPVVYGAGAVPRGAGPATSLMLNLLICLPAMLVLLRRLVDPAYTLRFAWSLVPMALLAMWMAMSVFWTAGDRFAAVVGTSHWLAAMVLLWTAAQLVRDWANARLLAGVCFGLLLVYTVHGFVYRLVEWPILLETWQQQREEFLQQRGWEEGDFRAAQFEGKLERGEILAFGASANTYAAMLVLFGAVTLGAIVQRLRDRDEWLWPAIMLAALPFAGWALYHAHSRTAWATSVLVVMMLAGVALLRRWLAAYPRAAFVVGSALIVLLGAAVVGHGIRHGTLFHTSLTFRWMYWLGSFDLFRDHWIAGVGWNTFGQHYLAYRLPAAPEEIKDPHNFLVKFLVELGIVGGLLLIGWMVRLWWELTRPTAPEPLRGGSQTRAVPEELSALERGSSTRGETGAVSYIVLLGAAGMFVNTLASLDWAIGLADLSLELLKRLLYLCVLVIGIVAVSLVSTNRQDLDERPAAWVLYGLLIALGVFLVHNLVDFSMFETGPMFVFALLTGAALGIRLPDASRPPAEPRLGGKIAAGVALGAGAVLWLLVLFAIVAPVVQAEERAHAGDDNLRSGYFARAAGEFQQAYQLVPYNGDYPFRAARALVELNAPPQQVREMLHEAIATDPLAIGYHLYRAHFELRQRPVDRRQVIADFERALELNPNDVWVRLDYARVLQQFDQPADARRQFELTLWYDAQLDEHEPKRLRREQLDEIENAMRLIR